MKQGDIVGRGNSLFLVENIYSNGIAGDFRCVEANDPWDTVDEIECNLISRYHQMMTNPDDWFLIHKGENDVH